MCTVCKSPSTLRLRRVAAAHASQVTVDRCALRRTVERAAHRPMPLQIAGAGWAGYPCQQPRPRRWIFATFGLWPAPPRLFGVSRGGRHDRLPVEGFVLPLTFALAQWCSTPPPSPPPPPQPLSRRNCGTAMHSVAFLADLERPREQGRYLPSASTALADAEG